MPGRVCEYNARMLTSASRFHPFTRLLPALLCAAIATGGPADDAHAEDWPEYRGEGRRGVWRESGIVDAFPAEGLKVSWRTPVDAGWSSPVVSDGRVFLTDFTRAERSTDVVERALCLDEETGAVLWTRSWDADYRTVGATWEGPRVTPTVDGGRVYVLGATGLLQSLDVETGEPAWTKDLMNDYGAPPPQWGFSSAPLVDGDRLITIVGGEDNARVVAFDKLTGEEIWRALPSDADIGVPQPVMIEAAGRRQLVIWFPDTIVSLDPTSGDLYWDEPVRTDWSMNIVPPVHSGSRLLISSFYNGSMMLALDDDRPDARLVWKGRSNNEIATDGLHAVMTTPVILGDHVYGVGSFGQLRALDAATGERLWETQDLIGERARWASAFIVAHEDRFFINNDRGDLIIAKFSPAGYEEISRTPLIAPTSNSSNRRRSGGVSWVAAAYANRHVVIRNDEEVLRASLAAADYPDLLPAAPAPARRAAVAASAAPAAADPARAPLVLQFAASGVATGDSTTFEFGEFYLLSGRGFNTPVFVTDDGIVAIDPARSGAFEDVRAEVDRITEAPITTIVHTRAHAADPEHWAGYPHLTDVVAHDEAADPLRRMLTGQRARFAPTRTYADALTLFEGRSQVDLHHFGAGATAGDAVLVMPRFQLAYLGDLFPAQGVPAIDTRLGGSALALPETLERAAALLESEGVTFIVPGRAAPPTEQTILGWLTVDDVREYAAFCRDLLEAVRDGIAAGRSDDEIVADLTLPERYDGYDLSRARPYVAAVRAELAPDAPDAAAQREPPAGIRPMSINAEDIAYPHPVRYLELTLHGEDVRMAYMDVHPDGAPNGRAVLLLHGMNWFGEYFRDTIAVLADAGFRVVVPDLVGFGRSSKPFVPYDFNLHAANGKALLDALGIPAAAVAGHSMGGALATRFARLYPDTATHLVLVNPIALTDARLERPYRRFEEAYERSLARNYETVRRTVERYFVTWKPEYDRYVNVMYAWTLSGEWPRLARVRALHSMLLYSDPVVYDRPHVRAKTLFLSGAEDGPRFRELARWIVDSIPNAELRLLDGVGHNPFMEAPERFFPPLLEFLESDPPPAAQEP